MSRPRPILLSLVLASMLPIAAGCGKKGPPLAPLRPVPAVVSNLGASRLGDTVRLQFTLPATNADESQPADLAYVDVYAVTGKPEGPLGRALTMREIETLLTRIARVEVQPPPEPVEEGAEGEPPPAPTPQTPAAADPRPVQGSPVSVEEVLTDAMRASVFTHPDTERVAKVRAAAGDDIDEAPVPSTEGTGRTLLWPQPTTETTRNYLVVPYSTRDRAGAPSAPLSVPLGPAPPAPPAPTVEHDAASYKVRWTTPAGVQLALQPTVTQEMYKAAVTAKDPNALLPARPLVTYGRPHTYRVYRLPSADAPPAQAKGPVNPAPLESPAFDDAGVEFGVPRCYAVRTVDTRGQVTLESPLSPVTCVTAVDTYPPPAPTDLVAVGSEGGVSLIWEPVTAPDLAGYLVLRGVDGEALKPITATPVVEATYRDTTAQPGVIYTYAVVAVDSSTPANASPESNRVRESAR